MINIATVHHNTSRFMEVQNEYLGKYTGSDFKVFCGVSNASPTVDYHKTIDFSNFSDQHWARLDFLAGEICKDSGDEEMLVFMDSDAFPICEWDVEIERYLKFYPVVAIVRKENPENLLPYDDRNYPHPCFLATTVGFWKDNGLSWELGSDPVVQTAGVVLHRKLKSLGVEWKPLLRSNAVDLHPLYFGIYGGLIYHHGAGNREVYDSIDIWSRPKLGGTVDLDLRHPSIPKFNTKLSQMVLDEIGNDDEFIKVFLGGFS